MTVDLLAENDQLANFQQLVVASARGSDMQELADRLLSGGKLTYVPDHEDLCWQSRGACAGRLRYLDEIGKGGMGQVFKAQHRHMNRVVALKVLSPDALQDHHAPETIPARGPNGG